MATATAERPGQIGYLRPELYPKQEEALFNPARYAVVEASSKAGKTVGCMAWLLEQAVTQGRPGRHLWWVAPILPQAKIAFRRFKRMLPPDLYTTNETEVNLNLANGVTIWFKGSDNPDSLYGEDVYAAVLDEATRMREEAWHAVRSTLTATRGPVRIIGNVKGRRNWAYRLARRAEQGEPGYHYARITAADAVSAGILDADEIEDARRTLPANVFGELYEAVPSDDGGNPFGIEAIQACVGPLHDCQPATWGWDLAKSVDWTVGVALCRHNAVCRFERWQRPWQQTISAIRQLVAATPTLVDSTGVGDPVLEALQDGSRNYEGLKFTATSKQQMMEGLAVAIQSGAISYPAGTTIISELEAYEYVYTRTGVRYSAPEGSHDDAVCALALAWHHATDGARTRIAAQGIAEMVRGGGLGLDRTGGIPVAPTPTASRDVMEWARG